MRINQFIARATGCSRRAADNLVARELVLVNGTMAAAGTQVRDTDEVRLDGKLLVLPTEFTTIMLHKPVGYVSSRRGQGSRTIYDLLPEQYHSLKPAGRLDKDSSGLLLMTSDGQLANTLTHPRYAKEKVYEVMLDKPLSDIDQQQIEQGVVLEDGPSRLRISAKGRGYEVRLSEGRNRQIRRTFASLGYTVKKLHRTHFGDYSLNDLGAGKFRQLPLA